MPSDEALGYFASYIERELGIVYARESYFQLQNRLTQIASLLEVDSVEQLHLRALKGIAGQFKQLLLDIATNNETSFFRDRKVFAGIESTVLPKLAHRDRGRSIARIWSAASSSGQEALSVAITVLEWSKKTSTPLDFEIIGSDISSRILAKAQSAAYTQLEIQRGLPTPLMLKYFKAETNELWTAQAELKGRIQYFTQNLMEPLQPPMSAREGFDLILCRNVLIYQTVERKAAILKRIHASLAPGGHLILGAAESLIGITDEFETLQTDGAILYVKKQGPR